MLSSAGLSAAAPETTPDGFILPVGDSFLKVSVRSENIVRIAFARDRAFFDRQSLVTVPVDKTPAWKFDSDMDRATVSTSKLQVRVDYATGAVSFYDAKGALLLAERGNGRQLVPMELQGEKSFHVSQSWEPSEGEALYGLGQNQLGLVNIKGYDIDLWQRNTSVVVPFLVSSRGFGLLWDNTSYTRFGDTRPWVPMPSSLLRDAEGKPGALTGSYFSDPKFKNCVATRRDALIDVDVRELSPMENAVVHSKLPPGDVSVRWEGSIVPEESGDYLFDSYAGGGFRLWVDDALVLDHWRQEWLPATDTARVRLQAGHSHKIRVDWTKDQKAAHCRLRWKTPSKSNATSLWSEMADGIDYTFIQGPSLDQVIAGYRSLTGQASLMPNWVFGLWQSRQRYETAQQSIDIVDGFRKRGIPFDVIVQDWQYWHPGTWGSHAFDTERFSDPDGWIKALHERHSRLMLSVWCKFYPASDNFNELRDAGLLYESNLRAKQKDWLGFPFTFVDMFNADARRVFWSQMDRQLFKRGVDAWWMDATEPDMLALPTLDAIRDRMNPTALGAGARYLNAYALQVARAVYEGQRSAAPQQRVFNLTRSGFAGQQRYAAATWSGDTTSTWTAMAKQIQAGLGFSISGVPYWTMDSGGFVVPDRFKTPEGQDEWCELNTRWFEFAAFTPILRAHGEAPNREMWEFGGESSIAYAAQLKFDRLRYRLFPYVYSLAGAVTHEGDTFMRPLVMDFREDTKSLDVRDQYLFGHAFLVSPVTHYQARSRQVYLPPTQGGWYDFWTGTALEGGRNIEAAAPYDAIPLHVRAGSIVPFGPELQYTGEKASDPTTLFVYAGADGTFSLYEDDGLSYGYEKGAFSHISITWNEAARTLSLAQRKGEFPGMLKERTFQVVLVSPESKVAFSFDPKPVATVHYTGAPVSLQLK
jgi:alpha-D-xyloside xylohydrolase